MKISRRRKKDQKQAEQAPSLPSSEPRFLPARPRRARLHFLQRNAGNNDVARGADEVEKRTSPSSEAPLSIQKKLGEGQRLKSSLQARMERAFCEDFSGVRVHESAGAASLSSQFDARAFTVGDQVAFGAGQYRPGTLIGDALIAHELAHVVQQKNALERGKETGGKANQALERDANRSVLGAFSSMWGSAKSAAAGFAQGVKPVLQTGLRLQRCAKTEKLDPPEYLGPHSVETLERINEIMERGDILQNTVVYGPLVPILTGPPGVPPTAEQARAAMAVPEITRSRVLQQIDFLYLDHGNELTQEEKAYWDRIRNLMNQ